MKFKPVLTYLILPLLCYILSTERATANHLDGRGTHWAYSTWLGTGVYKLNQEDMFILSLAGDLPLNKDPDLVYQLVGGLTIGLDNYGLKNIEIKFPDGVSSLQFTPGFQVTYRVHKRWYIKPFSQIGMGTSFVGGDDVYMFAAGAKSIYRASLKTLNIEIGNQLMTARHIDGSLSPDIFGKFDTGLNIKLPYSVSVFDTALDLNLFVMYTLFTSRVDELFTSHESSTAPLSWLGQLGFDVGKVSETKTIRAGFRYVFGEDNLTGVRLNLGFPF